MFRMRMNGTVPVPTSSTDNTAQGVWQVLFDTDLNGAVDWSLQLDQKTDMQMELYKGDNTTVIYWAGHDPTFTNVLNTTSPEWTDPLFTGSTFTSPYVEYNVPPTGTQVTNFDGDADYFLDLAMPRTVLGNALDSVRIALATSNDHQNINKDTPDVPWSPTTNVTPEPGALAVLLSGLGIAGLWRRRSRRDPIS